MWSNWLKKKHLYLNLAFKKRTRVNKSHITGILCKMQFLLFLLFFHDFSFIFLLFFKFLPISFISFSSSYSLFLRIKPEDRAPPSPPLIPPPHLSPPPLSSSLLQPHSILSPPIQVCRHKSVMNHQSRYDDWMKIKLKLAKYKPYNLNYKI